MFVSAPAIHTYPRSGALREHMFRRSARRFAAKNMRDSRILGAVSIPKERDRP
jgi:hypothetical protein